MASAGRPWAPHPPAITLGYASHAPATSSGSSNFLVGSSAHGHEAYAPAGPNSRAYATGHRESDTPPAGYPHSSSVFIPPSLFDFTMPLPDAAYVSGTSNTNGLPLYFPPPSQNNFHCSPPQPSSPQLTLEHLHLHDMAIPIPPPPVDDVPAYTGEPLPGRRDSVDSSSSTEPYSPSTTLATTEQPGRSSPERRHACPMCHKAFDRPSTLRKHLLVHTGEKAFQCNTCGRRFGVQSNLNRHAKKCGPRLAGSQTSARAPNPDSQTGSLENTTTSSPASAVAAVKVLQTTHTGSILEATPPPAPAQASRSRKRPCPSSDSTLAPTRYPASAIPLIAAVAAAPVLASVPSTDEAPKRKRRRRAPSPSRWVPDSLRTFDLTPYAKGTPVPLPPVQPFHDQRNRVEEERDSFDQSFPSTPYHPDHWCGKLPGPALLEREMNQMGGTVLVF